MKRLLSIAAIIATISTSAQKNEEPKSSNEKENKIETIKIVNGDTVYHEVRLVPGDMIRKEQKMKMRMYHDMSSGELSDEMQEMLDDIDIYINLDDSKKKMVIHRMRMHDEDFETFIEEWEDKDDMIIDLKSDKNQMKIIKIEIDDENGKEVKVIEVPNRRKYEDEEYRHHQKEGRSREREDPLKVFPNPTDGALNLEFEVMEGKPAELSITDMNGKKIFNKTYTEAGMVKEKIKLKESEKGMVVIRLLDVNRTISKSIIIE